MIALGSLPLRCGRRSQFQPEFVQGAASTASPMAIPKPPFIPPPIAPKPDVVPARMSYRAIGPVVLCAASIRRPQQECPHPPPRMQ
jgi:hypothetical protein